MNLIKLRRIATETRAWAEEKRQDAFPPDLEGMCAIVAQELFTRLKAAGFDAEVAVTINDYDGGSHCFVLVNSWIVDCTATQFGLAPVVIAPWESFWEKGHWYYKNIVGRFFSLSKLQAYLRETNWPMEQIRLAA